MKPTIKCLTVEELMERWGLTHRGSLGNWRVKGIGPKYMKIGRTILYPLTEVEAYEESQIRKSTVENNTGGKK